MISITKQSQVWTRLAVITVVVNIIFFTQLASRLEISFYDSYEYILAAQSLGDPEIEYPIMRPPLYSMILAMLLPDLHEFPDGLSFRSQYVLAVTMTSFFLIACFLFYRHRFDPFSTFIAVLLVTVNPLVIHYGPFPNHDLPAAFLYIVVSIAYLRYRRERSLMSMMTFGVGTALVISLRYQLALLVPIFAITELFLAINKDKSALRNWKSLRFWCGLLVLPVALAVSYVVGFFAIKFGTITAAIRALSEMFNTQSHQGALLYTDYWYEYFVTLPLTLTYPITALAILGIGYCCVRRGANDIYAIVSFAVIFFFHSFIFKHNETRYLLPIVVLFPYFATVGLERIDRSTARFIGKIICEKMLVGRQKTARIIGNLARRTVFILLFLPAVAQANREWRSFRDPVFTTPYWTIIGQYIRDHVPENESVYFHGRMTPLYPKRYIFHELDEFYNLYHFSNIHLSLLGQRKAVNLQDMFHLSPADTLLKLARDKATVVKFSDWDIWGKFAPPKPPDISIYSYDSEVFEYVGADEVGNVFRSEIGDHLRLSVHGNKYRVAVDLKFDYGSVYIRNQSGGFDSWELVPETPGQFTVNLPTNREIERVRVVYYRKRTFHPPGY